MQYYSYNIAQSRAALGYVFLPQLGRIVCELLQSELVAQCELEYAVL